MIDLKRIGVVLAALTIIVSTVLGFSADAASDVDPPEPATLPPHDLDLDVRPPEPYVHPDGTGTLLWVAWAYEHEPAWWVDWIEQHDPPAWVRFSCLVDADWCTRWQAWSEGLRYAGWLVWDDLARCESGGNWAYNGAVIYDGGLQFHPATWRSYRLPGYPEYAWQASRVQQIKVAERVLVAQGWGAWPHCSSSLGLR